MGRIYGTTECLSQTITAIRSRAAAAAQDENKQGASTADEIGTMISSRCPKVDGADTIIATAKVNDAGTRCATGREACLVSHTMLFQCRFAEFNSPTNPATYPWTLLSYRGNNDEFVRESTFAKRDFKNTLCEMRPGVDTH